MTLEGEVLSQMCLIILLVLYIFTIKTARRHSRNCELTTISPRSSYEPTQKDFFAGHTNLALKSKVIGTLLVFYELSGEIPAILQTMDADKFLKEIDSLGEMPSETSGGGEGLQPLGE